ncbi:MAG: VOC family protein [Saprospiraceae bacterium]|nr:VOC family protein [Saprospiraceae bacterium]
MKRVTGIGGVFFKAKDPKALAAWYQKHLHLEFGDQPYVALHWKNDEHPEPVSVFSFFTEQTDYFKPSEKPFMINFRVENLDALLAALREEGVQVMEATETMEGIGKFGWIVDPEGNKIELWQPA